MYKPVINRDCEAWKSAVKVGGDHILYFLLTTSWLEINWLAEQSVVHACARQLLSEKQWRLTAKNEGGQYHSLSLSPAHTQSSSFVFLKNLFPEWSHDTLLQLMLVFEQKVAKTLTLISCSLYIHKNKEDKAWWDADIAAE